MSFPSKSPEARRVYREKNREKLKAQKHASYLRNRERVLQKCAEYRNENKEKIRKWKKQHYEDNKEKIIAKQRIYNAAHVEQRNAASKAWREKNPKQWSEIVRRSRLKRLEIQMKRQKEWAKKNPERASFYVKRRRARRLGLFANHTEEEWKSILELHGHRCAYCGRKGTKKNPLSRDHYVALAKGGSDEARNIVPACRQCNSRKNKRDPLDFAQELGRLL